MQPISRCKDPSRKLSSAIISTGEFHLPEYPGGDQGLSKRRATASHAFPFTQCSWEIKTEQPVPKWKPNPYMKADQGQVALHTSGGSLSSFSPICISINDYKVSPYTCLLNLFVWEGTHAMESWGNNLWESGLVFYLESVRIWTHAVRLGGKNLSHAAGPTQAIISTFLLKTHVQMLNYFYLLIFYANPSLEVVTKAESLWWGTNTRVSGKIIFPETFLLFCVHLNTFLTSTLSQGMTLSTSGPSSIFPFCVCRRFLNITFLQTLNLFCSQVPK